MDFDIVALLKSIAVVVGTIRLFVKPIMVAIQEAVKNTETTKDDLILEKVLGSKLYKGLVFLLDYLGSIKLEESIKLKNKVTK